MGARIRATDWDNTPLGPVAQWPGPLRTTIRIMLSTNHPVFVFWGPRLTCFYNDAYARSLGPEKHPAILGMDGASAWPEIWPIIGPQIDQVMAGLGATWHENQLVPIVRHGRLEDVYWTYSYGPIDDERAPNGIGGVLVLCTETTTQVLAEQRLRESHTRWRALFDQAPGFICVLNGPDHRFEYANRSYLELLAQPSVVGRTVVECVPEAEPQGFISLLDRVYTTGEAFLASSAPIRLRRPDGTEDLRYLDFVYEPIRETDGPVTGVFVQGHDVTARTLVTLDLGDMLESIASGFMACSADWRVVYGNSAAERILGVELANLHGRRVWDLIPAAVAHEVEGDLRRAAAGEMREFEYRAPTDRWYLVRCYPRARGGVSISFEDCTERRQAEQLLQLTERRERERAEELETIMRHVPAAIWIAHDTACERITGNPRSYQLIRMEHGANASASAHGPAAERPFREYRDGVPVPPDDLPIQRAVRTGEVVPQSDITFVFHDGSVRHVFGGAAPLYDADGAVRGGVGAFVDVTDLRESEQKLIHRERELRTLADNTPDILARFDRQHRCVYINAAIERLTGHPSHALIGKANRDMGVPPALVDAWDGALQRAFGSGTTTPVDVMVPIHGEERHFLLRIVPEYEACGRLGTVLAVAQDVTDRTLAERALADADRRKDEFLATLAHELRNPLAPLRNGLEILELTADEATVRSVRGMMRRQLSHLVRLIDDLMEVSRISSGKVILHRSVVDLRAIVEQAVEGSRPAIDAGGHVLDVRFGRTPIYVEADVTRLAQVVSNLLNNAAKYTPDGGRIGLRVQRKGQEAVVRVSDTGVGIPAEMLSMVFEMFAQIDQTLQRSKGGLGIGLALAKRIMELHGGGIVASSAGLNRGSVFSCRLPVASIQPAPTAHAAGGSPPVSVSTSPVM